MFLIQEVSCPVVLCRYFLTDHIGSVECLVCCLILTSHFVNDLTKLGALKDMGCVSSEQISCQAILRLSFNSVGMPKSASAVAALRAPFQNLDNMLEQHLWFKYHRIVQRQSLCTTHPKHPCGPCWQVLDLGGRDPVSCLTGLTAVICNHCINSNSTKTFLQGKHLAAVYPGRAEG